MRAAAVVAFALLVSGPTFLETAKRSDVVVYAVAIGKRPTFLRDLARQTGGDVFDIESTKNADAAFTRVLEEFRHRYLVSYSPEGVTEGGWHRLDVRGRRPGAKVQARPGYFRDAR